MKIIIIGLGNFGESLSLYLTDNRHEVLGIDINMNKIDKLKNQISHVVCMDATDETAYKNLPIKEASLAIIAIGRNEGCSIIATAILKKYINLKIISRSISDIHNTILNAMGINHIIHPEKDSAFKLTNLISFKNLLNFFNIRNKHSIIEIICPNIFLEKSVKEVNFIKKFKIYIIAIFNKELNRNLSIKKNDNYISEIITGNTIFKKNDILILFGLKNSIINFIKNKI